MILHSGFQFWPSHLHVIGWELPSLPQPQLEVWDLRSWGGYWNGIAAQDPGAPWRCQGLESSGDIGHTICFAALPHQTFRKCVDSCEGVFDHSWMAKRELSSDFWSSLFANDMMIPEWLRPGCHPFLFSLGIPHRTSSFGCFEGQVQGWSRDRTTTVQRMGNGNKSEGEKQTKQTRRQHWLHPPWILQLGPCDSLHSHSWPEFCSVRVGLFVDLFGPFRCL